MTTHIHTNTQAVLGMIHAQELLMVSLIRALPPETRLRVVDEYQAQVERDLVRTCRDLQLAPFGLRL